MKKAYCIGLDIGTSSVGWALTSTYGTLLKHKKRSTFGTVLFSSAETAADRRTKRSARRRLDRKEQRIDLLQELMAPDVLQKDDAFYIRLNESFLQHEEQKYPNLYGTLPDHVFKEGEPFHPKTIYHLRAMLTQSTQKADIRYVYLAIHHIIKYRGHFIFENATLQSSTKKAKGDLLALLDYLNETFAYDLCQDESALNNVLACLEKANTSRRHKKEQITAILLSESKGGNDRRKAADTLATFMLGMSGSLKTLFGYEGETLSAKVTMNADLDVEAYMDALNEHADAFANLVDLYRWQIFASLGSGGNTISHMMVKRYEQHQQDLKALKAWVKKHCTKETYDEMFRNPKGKVNYNAYVGHETEPQKETETDKRCTQEDFYKYTEKLLQSGTEWAQDTEVIRFLEAMKEENGFLPIQRIRYNGMIPNQMHAQELELLLDKQGVFYPTLKENRDKILSLCTFRLPYYVGPLNTASPFQKWLKRDRHIKITPWNFDEAVDRIETANGFIANLTNQCTYLPSESVLPLHSLLFEEYVLLDELNRIRINGELISIDLKKKAFQELFLRRKKVTIKAFTTWLKDNSNYREKEVHITGFHGEDGFLGSLEAHIDLLAKGFELSTENKPMLEQLLHWSTVFESRTILRQKIQQSYPRLPSDQVDFLCRKRYRQWGRLSAKLLDGVLGEYEGQPATIIEVMRQSNMNLMQILHDKKLGFDKAIENEQPATNKDEITIEEVQALQGSPALKRGIWQAVKVVQELIENQGSLPQAIYLENTRDDDVLKKGKRTTSRIAQIEKYVMQLNASDYTAEYKTALIKAKKDNLNLSDRQFLYFIQLGKCLYSGQPLDFSRLSEYQIDHILPQCYIKDDSIDNRALVRQVLNQDKGDNLLLSESIRTSQRTWWQYLYKQGLLSNKKFTSLNRPAVEPRDMLGFINRQLVEASQIISHVTALFKQHYPNVTVRAVKAQLTSSLRQKYDLYKLRELNDMHHAFDALLTCTLGLFIDDHLNWLSDESVWQKRILAIKQKLNKRNTNGLVLDLFGNDQVDGDTGEVLRSANSQINYLKQAWNYKDGFLTSRKYEQTGQFFNETRYPAGSINAVIPLRKHLPTGRYGGFTGIKPAYMAAITYQKENKRVAELINIPIYIATIIKDNPRELKAFLEQSYKDVEILRPKILLNQLVEYEGNLLLLRSCSESWNGKTLYLDYKTTQSLHRIIKLPQEQWNLSDEELDALFVLLINKIKKQYPIYGGIVDRLTKVDKEIRALSIVEKGILIKETLKIMQISGAYAMYKRELKLLSDNQGRITNKPFYPESITFIDQSITGLHERRTKL